MFIQKSKQNKQEFKTGLFDVILDNVVAASARSYSTYLDLNHSQTTLLTKYFSETNKAGGIFPSIKTEDLKVSKKCINRIKLSMVCDCRYFW